MDKEGHAGTSCFSGSTESWSTHKDFIASSFSSMIAVFCQVETVLARNETVAKAAGTWINHEYIILIFVKV